MIYVKSKKILFLLKDNIPRKGNSCEKTWMFCGEIIIIWRVLTICEKMPV